VGAECSESYLTHYYDIKRLKGEIFKWGECVKEGLADRPKQGFSWARQFLR
jgi:hypothetical protein